MRPMLFDPEKCTHPAPAKESKAVPRNDQSVAIFILCLGCGTNVDVTGLRVDAASVTGHPRTGDRWA